MNENPEGPVRGHVSESGIGIQPARHKTRDAAGHSDSVPDAAAGPEALTLNPLSDLSAALDMLEDLGIRGIRAESEVGMLRLTGPVGALDGELRATLAASKPMLLEALAREDRNLLVVADVSRRHDPFPLTGIQQGFLVGEQEGFYAHARPAISVFEYAVDDLDVGRVEQALRTLTTCRDALRLAVFADGTQRYLEPEPGEDLLEIIDLSGCTATEALERADALRAGLTQRLRPLEEGRPLHVTAVRLPQGYRMQIAVRLIAFDLTTLQEFLAEFRRCYLSPDYRPEPQAVTHRDYVMWLEDRRSGLAHRRAKRYWAPKLEQVPEPPALPKPPPGAAGSVSGFGMATVRLTPQEWEAFQKLAADREIAAVPAVVALFTESLHRWSEHRRHHITLVVSNRAAAHESLHDVWGNFNTSVLLDTDSSEGPLTLRAQALQAEMHAHLDHLDVSGVDLVRQLQRARTDARSSPVVVTAVLQPQRHGDGGGPVPGARLLYQRTMPSLVELSYDMHVDSDGGLRCTAYYAAEAYPPGMIDSLMEHHEERLQRSAADAGAWDDPEPGTLPALTRRERAKANDTAEALTLAPLHMPFAELAPAVPEDTAILAGERSITYGELERTSARIADELAAQGLRPGDIAGIILPRGTEYVSTILAVARLGATYLPLGTAWPADRLAIILARSGARLAVCEPERLAGYSQSLPCPCTVLPAPGAMPTGSPAVVDPASRAYVIFTSGSTGVPKGVVISHRAAANTITALKQLLEIGPADRFLAVSAPTFDLSVFDIFAALGTGAALVFPPSGPGPAPGAWAQAIHTHKVTIWNSVPALMSLLLDHLGGQARETLASLRVIMLSGDWVPVSLIERLRLACPDARILALGGATEASIWSNWFDTGELDELDEMSGGWTHVPYGYPLPNQQLHVLDARLEDSPAWVAGDLYISGDGLAEGYLNEPAKTAESFIIHPRTGVRMYRTGDRARYRPGGVVEFLGRTDLQVKIGGYRIELGEIDAHLMTHPDIEAAATTTVPGPSGAVLAAFVTTTGSAQEKCLVSVQAYLRQRLPAYMVPNIIRQIETLPLTGNGKVDRASLAALETLQDDAPPSDELDALPSGTVLRLREVWREVFGGTAADTADFFAIGGNSLAALRLFRRIGEVFGVEPRLSEIFTARTIRSQARLIDSRREPTEDLTVPIHAPAAGSADSLLFLIHPIGGHVVCYTDLAGRLAELAPGTAVYGIRAAGLHPGEELPGSVTEQAKAYAAEINRLIRESPAGALHLAGWSMGGTIALELARLLDDSGTRVGSVTLLDSYSGDPNDGGEEDQATVIASFFADMVYPSSPRIRVPDGEARECLLATQQFLFDVGALAFKLDADTLERHYELFRHNGRILRAHRPTAWTGRTRYVIATRSRRDSFPGLLPIMDLIGAAPENHRPVDADHYSLVLDTGAAQAAAAIAGLITEGNTR